MSSAQYIAQFIVYALAMIGILVIACVVYKKAIALNPIKKNSMLSIVEMMRLPDRKMLYIVKCKKEQFLIASSNDSVSLISKLDNKNEEIEKYLSEKQNDEEKIQAEPSLENKHVMKSLLKELSDKNQFRRGNY